MRSRMRFTIAQLRRVIGTLGSASVLSCSSGQPAEKQPEVVSVPAGAEGLVVADDGSLVALGIDGKLYRIVDDAQPATVLSVDIAHEAPDANLDEVANTTPFAVQGGAVFVLLHHGVSRIPIDGGASTPFAIDDTVAREIASSPSSVCPATTGAVEDDLTRARPLEFAVDRDWVYVRYDADGCGTFVGRFAQSDAHHWQTLASRSEEPTSSPPFAMRVAPDGSLLWQTEEGVHRWSAQGGDEMLFAYTQLSVDTPTSLGVEEDGASFYIGASRRADTVPETTSTLVFSHGAAADAPLDRLATQEDASGGTLTGFALDDRYVYWTTNEAAWRLPKPGGAAERIATGDNRTNGVFHAAVVHGAYLYFLGASGDHGSGTTIADVLFRVRR